MAGFFKPNFWHLGLIAGTFAIQAAVPSLAFADIVISSAPTSNVTCSSGICTPTSSSAVLNVNDLQTLLASGSVKLAAAGEPVDVDIDAALSWVSTNTLTLDSYHSINVEQPVAITGGGGLAIITNDGGTGGEFSFAPATNVAIWSLSSSLTINGTGYTLVDDIATLASDIAANASGSYALAANYNAAPDGTYPASPVSTNFAGNFQGLGNTISNLTISNVGQRNTVVGLFAVTEPSATISNAVLQNASVKETGKNSGGGLLVGSNLGTLFGDHTSGTIAVTKVGGAGGLVGGNGGTILDSSSSASVTGKTGAEIGGLVGVNSGTINGCFATGVTDVSEAGNENSAIAGGLAGYSEHGSIANSYATGTMNGSARGQLGGLVGQFQANTVSTSYSTGEINGKDRGGDGGFIGFYVSGTASNSYWDTTTSGTTKASGDDGSLAGVTGESTKKLQAHLPAGFDPTIWAESPSINNGFPYLIANPPQ